MRIFALLTAVVLLAACSSNSLFSDTFDSRVNVGACPPAGSLYQASRIVDLDGGSEVYGNIAYTGEIVDVRLFCRYAGTNPVHAEIEVDFAFGKGPKGTERQHEFTYWVAVTRRSGKVLNKAYFSVQADFSDGPVTGRSQLIQRIIIPRADESISAANFEVLVGFDLTEEQLQFNKDGHRFRLNAGQ